MSMTFATDVIHSNPVTNNNTVTNNAKVTYKKGVNGLLTGSGTAGQAGSSSAAYVPAKWTFNAGMTPAAGDIITIKIPVAGVNAGVWLSVDNGSNYHPVAFNGTARLTTHFAKDYLLTLIYETGIATGLYGNTVSGGAAGASITNYTLDRWRVMNAYDTNTTYSAMSVAEMKTGTATSNRVMQSKLLNQFLDALLCYSESSAPSSPFKGQIWLKKKTATTASSDDLLNTSHKIVSITLPTATTSYVYSNSWITANTMCYNHSPGTGLIASGKTVSWTFAAGKVTFTISAALSATVTFQFGMLK